MRKSLVIVLLCLIPLAGWAQQGLTELETRWLNAGGPVLDYAEAQGLPLDIIVQPQPRPGDVPLAMGFADGRCQLVLSLRQNPDAESILTTLEPAQQAAAIETMMAHELAHCWRRINGAWHTSPAGFTTVDRDATGSKQTEALRQEMEQTRREEGFADLFGLAWTLQRHPEQYAEVYSWLKQVREEHAVPGTHHDTSDWIRLAAERTAFEAQRSPFEQAQTLWTQGLSDNKP